MYSQLITFCISFIILLGISGCTTVPGTGRSALILVPESMLIEQSNSLFREMRRKNRVSTNTKFNAMVRRVGRNIAQVVRDDMPATSWDFIVFEDSSQANAFAMPGGKVGIFTGIFDLVDQDADLATVISHEIAHVVARHGNQRVSQQLLLTAGGIALGVALDDEDRRTRNAVLSAYGAGTTLGITLPYSRGHELEADKLGLIYMARAGYDPRRSLVFWEKMMVKQRAGVLPEFLSTHPAHRSRLRQLNATMDWAVAEYDAVRSLN
ncbi:MAG: M48 family metallopeptidase [Opitutae bacterium]|nr:M48 family metallopeptidase [Opitutae bacterium]